MTPRPADKKRKRGQILQAALKVLARQGISNFKMIDIAQKAKVGKGTLYEYFPSKDELVIATFNLVLQDYEDYVAAQLESHPDPVRSIKALISATCEFFASRRERLDVMFDFWAAGTPRRGSKPLLAGIDKIFERTARRLAMIVDEGVKEGVFRPIDSTFVASLILATLDGILFQAVLGLVNLDAETLPEDLSRILLEGIMK